MVVYGSEHASAGCLEKAEYEYSLVPRGRILKLLFLSADIEHFLGYF